MREESMSRMEIGRRDPLAVASRLVWVLSGLAFVAVVPSRLYLGVGPTVLSGVELPLILGMGLGYLLATALAHAVPDRAWTPLWAGPVGFLVAYGFLLLVPEVQASRIVVLVSTVLGTGLLVLDRRSGVRARLASAAVATAVVAGLVVVDVVGTPGPVPSRVLRGSAEIRLTGLHGLRVSSFTVPDLAGRYGGGLVRADSVLVVADGDGDLGVLDPTAPENWRGIDVDTPMDIEAMRNAAGRDDHAARMRVLDVLVRRDGEGWDLFLSHHVFHADRLCYAVRVSRIRVDDALRSARAGEDWEPVFETRPCVPYLQGDRREPFFRGNDSGGRLAWLRPDVLLLTVGDHWLTGMAGDPAYDLGKTIRIDLREGGEARHFTSGHRNPQGLVVVGDTIWSAEHGPQGGDELNRLEEGGDYGWGRTTLGTNYGSFSFDPVPSRPGDRLREPVHAWMPSLGISDVTAVEGRGFHRWQGDLLVASLKAGELRRLRIRDGLVAYDEPIPIGRRIRALTEDARGAIWLRTDGAELLRLEVDDAGAEAWTACTQCHALREDPSLQGPHLDNLEGRPVASVRGFEYSSALRALGGRWTLERLDAFLADPQAFAPGTTMEMGPIPDPEIRRRIVNFLRSVGAL